MKRETYPKWAGALGLCAAALILSGTFAVPANADVIDIPIEDAMPTEFWSFGDSETTNPNGLFDLGGGSKVTVVGVGWDLQVTADDPAKFSDFGLALISADGPFDTTEGLFLAIADGDDDTGEQNYSTGGIVMLSDVGLPEIQLENGMLYGELFTFAPGKEGLSISGTLSLLYIPAPGTLGLLACAGLCGIGRRRR